MVDNDDVKDIGSDVEKFDRRVSSINIEADPYRNKQEFEDLERWYQKLSSKIEECDNDIQDSSMTSNKKPLINKLNQYKSGLDIAKNKLNEKKNRWKTQYNIELLKEGKLTGAEKIKTERDMILEQHKETDYQGNIIDSIASNIKDTNRNLEGINTELKSQGDQMNRIHDHAMNADTQVKQTEKIMTKMERRQKCMKVIGGIAVVIFGIFDIVWLIFWIIRRFAKK
jgi:methyl-accepting chemotaxis protein